VSRCVLELVINGEAQEPDAAAEVMELVCHYACPGGDCAADLQLDHGMTTREVAALILRMLRPAHSPKHWT
jgi:hypothetical protein